MSTVMAELDSGISVNKFWGGVEVGGCIQITSPEGQYVQLTLTDAHQIANLLAVFCKDEAVRRQGLLKQKIKDLRTGETNVFSEICELSPELFSAQLSAISLIDQFTPKHSVQEDRS